MPRPRRDMSRSCEMDAPRGEDEPFDEGEFEGLLDAVGGDDEFVGFFSQVGTVGVDGECHRLIFFGLPVWLGFRNDRCAGGRSANRRVQ